VEFILHDQLSGGGWFKKLLFPERAREVYTPDYYSLYEVMEFILNIINPCARSIMESILHIIIPCTGSWSLDSTLLFPVRGRGVYTSYYYSLYGVVRDFVGAQE